MARTFSLAKPMWMAFLMLLSGAVSALTLNPLIEAPDGHRLINQEPLLFNDQIIFVTEKDDDYSLWSYDLIDHSYTTLHTFDDYFYPKFYVIGNYFYFKDRFEPNILWQSDGTPSGMRPMGSTIFYQTPLYKKGDLIFARGGSEGGSFVAFDGQAFSEYIGQLSPMNPDTPAVNFACGFGIQDVIFANQPSYGNKTLIRRKPGGSFVNYTDELPPDFEIYEDRVWFLEDTCFYYISGQNLSDILVIPEQGDHYFLSETIGYEGVSYITYFKDHFYAIATASDGNSQILKFSSDLSAVEKQVESDSNLYFTSLTVSDQYLIALADTGPLATPTVFKQTYFDENLNIVEGLGGNYGDVPEIYPRDNGETVVFNNYANGINQKTITTDITDKASGLVLKGESLSSVIVNEDATETYVLVRELQTGEYGIKKLDDVPDMGSLSVGNWFDPDYKNQGLSIVEGQRDDGSHYLFVTMYLFRDGQQLWLAGTNNINAPQKELTITLGEYDGIGLFEPGVTPNETVFGEVELEMTGCHQMAATVTTADMQVFTVDLQRMENTLVNHLCKD